MLSLEILENRACVAKGTPLSQNLSKCQWKIIPNHPQNHRKITWHKSIFMKNKDFYKNFFLKLSRIFPKTFKIESQSPENHPRTKGQVIRKMLLIRNTCTNRSSHVVPPRRHTVHYSCASDRRVCRVEASARDQKSYNLPTSVFVVRRALWLFWSF